MEDTDRIYELLGNMNTEQVAQGKDMAAMKQALADAHTRLFGGPGQKGVLEYLVENQKTLTQQVTDNKAAAIAGDVALGVRIGKTETRIKVYAATGTGFWLAIQLFGKAALAKLGWHQ